MWFKGLRGKLGPIDDCSEAQLNFASTSYLKLQDVDDVSGLALRIASSVIKGKQKSGSGRWLGKCLDLSKPQFHVSNSLMFGRGLLYSFNRVSLSLWFLLNRMLLIPCSLFYDDFPVFSPEELATRVDSMFWAVP